MSERDKSERLPRIARAVTLAERVFGDQKRALQWLHDPKRSFGGKAPIELFVTAEGCRRVEAALVLIDEGYVA